MLENRQKRILGKGLKSIEADRERDRFGQVDISLCKKRKAYTKFTRISIRGWKM